MFYKKQDSVYIFQISLENVNQFVCDPFCMDLLWV